MKPHECDFCPGTVYPVVVTHEPLRVADVVVILDGIEIGRCDRCGHRYFPSDILKRATAAARDPDLASRTETVPVIAA